MSEVRLVVREAKQDWSGTIHGSDADLAIAALCADPVTLAEFKTAASRFVRPDNRKSLFQSLRPGFQDEPYDAGLVVIDLVARLVAIDSTYSSPGPVGSIRYRAERNEDDVVLPYHLADDWLFFYDSLMWQASADQRRQERSEIRRWMRGPSCMAHRCWNSWHAKHWRLSYAAIPRGVTTPMRCMTRSKTSTSRGYRHRVTTCERLVPAK